MKKQFTIEDSTLQMQSTAVFTPTHPEHGGLESLQITFNSQTSAEYQNYTHQVRADMLSKVVLARGKDDRQAVTAKDVEESTKTDIEMLARMVIAWGDGYTKGGKPMDVTVDNVRAVFTDPKTSWIYRQASVWFANEANFFLPVTVN